MEKVFCGPYAWPLENAWEWRDCIMVGRAEACDSADESQRGGLAQAGERSLGGGELGGGGRGSWLVAAGAVGVGCGLGEHGGEAPEAKFCGARAEPGGAPLHQASSTLPESRTPVNSPNRAIERRVRSCCACCATWVPARRWWRTESGDRRGGGRRRRRKRRRTRATPFAGGPWPVKRDAGRQAQAGRHGDMKGGVFARLQAGCRRRQGRQPLTRRVYLIPRPAGGRCGLCIFTSALNLVSRNELRVPIPGFQVECVPLCFVRLPAGIAAASAFGRLSQQRGHASRGRQVARPSRAEFVSPSMLAAGDQGFQRRLVFKVWARCSTTSAPSRSPVGAT